MYAVSTVKYCTITVITVSNDPSYMGSSSVDPGPWHIYIKQERNKQKQRWSEEWTDSDGILPNKEKCTCPKAPGTETGPGKVTKEREGAEQE